MFNKKVRLIDIAREIERDKSTIIRWEEMGFIPVAKRDSRGWRYYTEEEARLIVEKVRATHYFKDITSKVLGAEPPHERLVYIG